MHRRRDRLSGIRLRVPHPVAERLRSLSFRTGAGGPTPPAPSPRPAYGDASTLWSDEWDWWEAAGAEAGTPGDLGGARISSTGSAHRIVLADGSTAPVTAASSRRHVILRFAAVDAALVLVLVILGLVLAQVAARREAVADARNAADLLAASVVQPALSSGLAAGDPVAVAAMDRVVRRRVLSTTVVRVKIWTRDGHIVYSDEKRLLGARFGLEEDETRALDLGLTQAQVSDLSKPENTYENGFGKLLEVYRPVRDPAGHDLLFETYSRYASVSARSSAVFGAFAPVTLFTAILLGLLQWPLVRWVLRQLDTMRAEREQLLVQALAAGDEERRRIVGNLHDGIVQDLTGASLVVTGAAASARRTGRDDLADEMGSAAEAVRRGLRGLRSALVEIYPPVLDESSLVDALGDLVAPLRSRGMQVDVDLPIQVDAPAAVEALVYRVAQEAVRNVAKHSGAARMSLRLAQTGTSLLLEVQDDGVGFEPRHSADGTRLFVTERDDGTHVGLSLLADVARQAGARLELLTTPGQGTTVRVEVPLL